MAKVTWSVPGNSGNWDSTASWSGLPLVESYPGQFAVLSDDVTIGANLSLGNSAYTVTFNVAAASVDSLEIDGGIGAANSTTLELQGDNVLTIQGGVTFVINEASAVIDGSGTLNIVGGLISTTGLGPARGTFMAGTDTTGGILDLAGITSISGSSAIVFAISKAAPSTLRFDLTGTVVSTEEITIDDPNQTLEVGASATLEVNAIQDVIGGTIKMSGGTFMDNGGLGFGGGGVPGFLSGFRTVSGRLSTSLGATPSIIKASGGNLTLTDIIERDVGLEFDIDSTAASTLQLNGAVNPLNTFTFLGAAGELALSPTAAGGVH